MSHDINKQLADIFNQMSLLYKYSGNNNRFRALSYERASRLFENSEVDVSALVLHHKKTKGIGKSISDKIIEFVNTGKIYRFEELKKNCPIELLQLLKIRGFGPKTLRILHEQVGIVNLQQLKDTLQSNNLKSVKGLGINKIEAMKEGLKLHEAIKNRMLLWDALKLADSIIAWIKKCRWVTQVEIAGSLRRQKETIGDLDLVVSCEKENSLKVINYITDNQIAASVILKGNERITIIAKDINTQIDVLIVPNEEWGSALQHFTGSKEHNISLRTATQKNGFKLSEHGILNLKTNDLMQFKTEKEFYNYLGYEWIPPELRENKGELAISLQKKLPQLISISDLKGDLHIHSNWSDGSFSIAKIAEHMRQNYSYDYIAITDHSKSSVIARGITEKQLEQQLIEIKLINEQIGFQYVKSGIEVDILNNGKLDFSDELLSKIDWVTASIHRGFNKDNTDRIIAACQNKYVDCIGHPTGRLIGTRNPYKINFNEVINVAKKTGTALEINAQSNRMDLSEEYVFIARENNVPLVISSDAHHTNEFNYIKLGVSIARRAWCEKDAILNTLSWDQISKWKARRTKKIELL
jgi:DNA polymerase (family 10)